MMQPHELQKKIGNEIRKLRLLNEWTQEQVAEKLHICRKAYGDMERGETDIHLSRLIQVAGLFSVDLEALLCAKQSAVYYIQHHGKSNQQKHYNQCHHISEEKTAQQELEKTQFLLEFKDKEISLLEQKIVDLQRIIALLDKK